MYINELIEYLSAQWHIFGLLKTLSVRFVRFCQHAESVLAGSKNYWGCEYSRELEEKH